MMTAVVFNPEMSIDGHRQYNFCQRSFQAGFFVPKFMTGVDAKATGNTGDGGETNERPPAECLRARPPGGAN